jgi:transcriptional regulator with XRE-family HTH domain
VGLGDKLKELRSKKNVSQQEVAKYLNVDRSTYGKYETGDSSPDYEKLLKLASYFNTTTDYLLGYDDNSNPTIAAHRTNGYDTDLPDEAKEMLRTYVEFLKQKYTKIE